jgi:hypothetical protein
MWMPLMIATSCHFNLETMELEQQLLTDNGVSRFDIFKGV